MTELKQTVYKTIEVAEDEDYGMVIGNIVMDGDKMLYAEITGGTMCNHEELVNVRAFLDEVEDAMTTNTSNVYNAETTPIINEECARCCKVVDIAAKLQEKLDEYKETILVERIDRAAEKKMINRKFCEDLRKLHATIEEYKEAIQLERIDHITTLKTVNQYHHTKIKALKDSNIDDLKELYDFHEGELEWFKDVISTRDLSIKALTIMCQSSGSIRNDLTSTIGEKDKMLEKYRCEIVGLRDMHDVVWDKVHALEAELVISKGVVTAKDIHIAGLKAELSARKDDSAVLMEVVEIIKDDTIPNSKVPCVIFNLVKDYLDAPEGPPETPIDDLYKVTVAYTFLELP